MWNRRGDIGRPGTTRKRGLQKRVGIRIDGSTVLSTINRPGGHNKQGEYTSKDAAKFGGGGLSIQKTPSPTCDINSLAGPTLRAVDSGKLVLMGSFEVRGVDVKEDNVDSQLGLCLPDNEVNNVPRVKSR